MNILQWLAESEEEWLTEAVIKARAQDEPPESKPDPQKLEDLVERLLETLVDRKLIDYQVGKGFVESYRLTDRGLNHLTRERTRRETMMPPPFSRLPANDA